MTSVEVFQSLVRAKNGFDCLGELILSTVSGMSVHQDSNAKWNIGEGLF